MRRNLMLTPVLAMVAGLAFAAEPLTFEVAPDRADMMYLRGEKTVFTVTANGTNGVKATAGRVVVHLDDTGADVSPVRSVDLAKENPFTVEGTLAQPGFLRLTLQAEGTPPQCWSTGYEPEKIVKGSPSPADFDAFWAAARAKLAREVPLDAKTERVPEWSRPGYDFYRISFATFGRRVYGLLSIPTDKAKAPFPVRIQVSAAGFGGWTNYLGGSADEIRAFFAVLPIQPDLDWEKKGLVRDYEALEKTCKDEYGCGYACAGISKSREDYFFYPALLGIDRAVDWIAANPYADRSRFRYYGVSQGGGFGFYLCALNRNFTCGAVFVPAITDILGRKAGRVSGWPRLVENQRPENRAAAERNAPYFDAANFAARIRCPFWVAVGFSDQTCPPSAVYAAYNAIPGTNKTIAHGYGMTHGVQGRFAQEVEEFYAGVKRAPEAANFLNNLRRLPRGGRYAVAWTHPWYEYGSEFCERDAKGVWRAKPLDRMKLDGYVKQEAGKDPLLYFTDFYCCLGTWESPSDYARANANMEGFIRKAYDEWHSVPVFSWHIENPYAPHRRLLPPQARGCGYRYRWSCDGYPQEHRYVLKEILEGTGGPCGGGRAKEADEKTATTFPTPRAWYDAQLDKVCDFLLRLKDRTGRPIPAVVRFFHECEDDWPWWGPGSVSAEDYRRIFRYSVEEVRRRTGLDSLLFLYSPDRYWSTREQFMSRYPGDDVVDIIGFDDYSIGGLPKNWTGDRSEGVEKSLEGTIARMRVVSKIARERGKPAGLVETGVGRDEQLTRLKSYTDGVYGLLGRMMRAPGVEFSFFNTWGGNCTVPKSEAGKRGWLGLLNRPEALTARKGYDPVVANGVSRPASEGTK